MKKRVIAILLVLAIAQAGCGNKTVVQEPTAESEETTTEASIEETEESTVEAESTEESAEESSVAAEDTTEESTEASTEASEETTETSEEESKEPEESKPAESQESTADTSAKNSNENDGSSDTTPSDSGTGNSSDTTDDGSSGGNTAGGQTPEPTPTPEPEQPEVHVHTWVEDITEATCEAGKVITTKCSSCGYVDGTRTEGSGLGHDFVEVLLYGASCKGPGYRDVTCSRCKIHGPGHGDIPMLPHTEVATEIVHGDCIHSTIISIDCGVCGMHIRRDTHIEADGHDWIEVSGEIFDENLLEWIPITRIKCSICEIFKQ